MGFEGNYKNKLMAFERKGLRRIFGPTKQRNGTWKIKRNDELDELIRHKNIINHIKAQRLTLRRLMSYIYGAPILDVSRSHTTTQHSR